MAIISNFTDSDIYAASSSLITGHLVAFPTETVYGLGADASNQNAVARIYEVKGRPTDHPLIVHISSIKGLDKWAKNVPEYAMELAINFWPGPMTLILPRTGLGKDFLTGGQDCIGLRVPAHAVALSLLKEFEAQGGHGIAAPSANRFGKVSPTSMTDVIQELHRFLHPSDIILDGGNSLVGIESTIINCTEEVPIILRPGAITTKMISKVTGLDLDFKSKNNNYIKTSGSLDSHYSPDAKVFISGAPAPGDGFIALSDIPTPRGAIRLASPANNQEYANVLYRALRLADIKKISSVFVIPPSGYDIAVAINDRLQKASRNQLERQDRT
jgi:L-threonylcarbamoyladenylate synthase